MQGRGLTPMYGGHPGVEGIMEGIRCGHVHSSTLAGPSDTGDVEDAGMKGQVAKTQRSAGGEASGEDVWRRGDAMILTRRNSLVSDRSDLQ